MAKPKRPTQTTPPRKVAPPPPRDEDEDEQEEEQDRPTTLPAQVTGSRDLATSDLSKMLLEDTGAGRELVRPEDMQIPQLRILQSNSPEVNKHDGAYVDDAEQGDFFNNVTREVWSGEKGIWLIPVMFIPTFIEWVLRDAGGGFITDHGLAEGEKLLRTTKKDEKKRDILPNGNQLVRTAQHFCLQVLDGGMFDRVVVPMTSTQLSMSRRWNTMMASLQVPHPVQKNQTFNPATFYMAYRFVTIPQENDQGSWMGWDMKEKKPVIELKNGNAMYVAARNFKQALLRGGPQVVQDAQAGAAQGQGAPF